MVGNRRSSSEITRMWYYVENLTQQSLKVGDPWTFKIEKAIPAQIREVKESRQEWYRNTQTKHWFYTPFEPICNTQRPSKSNEVFTMAGLPADFDAKIPMERVLEVVAAMKVKPMWIERSLGGGVRLVWVFESPLKVHNNQFCMDLLKRLRKAFNLDLLPALDEGALADPNRLFCNGGEWTPTGAGPVPSVELQFHVLEVARNYNFQGGEYNAIPLDVVEVALRKQFPSFSWPGDFRANSQGPSFWIPESTSPLSAIVKDDGLFTFSAHASKPFYKWTDLLGAEFCEGYRKESFAKATDKVYFCGESNFFWYPQIWNKPDNCDCAEGDFHPARADQFSKHLRMNVGLSSKPGDRGSDVDKAIAYIQHYRGIHGAAPFLFDEREVVPYNGGIYLNVAARRQVVKPNPGKHEWGPHGDFPYWSGIIDHLLDPLDIQKDHLLAFWRRTYQSAYEHKFVIGQSCFFGGVAGCGKTTTCHEGIGKSMGGSIDAGPWFLKQTTFGSEIYHYAIWTLDDTVVANEQATQTFHSQTKRLTANQAHLYHRKFHTPFMIDCKSRALVTLNLDFNSVRLLPPLDNSSAEKINVYRCVTSTEAIWDGLKPAEEGQVILERELPNLLGWLLDTSTDKCWTTGKEATRYGIISYHEPSLVQQAQSTTRASGFGDVVDKFMLKFFAEHPSETSWTGATSDLLGQMGMTPEFDIYLRTFKVENISRDLEACKKYKQLKFETAYTSRQRKVYVFQREHYTEDPSDKPETFIPPPVTEGDFRKES